MSTMEKLVARFNRLNPDYIAELCTDSWELPNTVYITEPVCGLTSRYVFDSCRDFKDWMDGVILD